MKDGSVKVYEYDVYRKSEAPKDSVASLVSAYQRSPKWQSLSGNTRTSYSLYLRIVDETMGTMPVGEVRRRHIIGLRDRIASKGRLGSATVFARVMGSLFSWAIDNDWLDTTPVQRIKGLPGGHIKAWTDIHAARALSGLPDRLRRVVILGLYTGQRRGDLLALRWNAYDGHEIRFKQQKTGVELVLAVHPELKRELDTWERTSVTILADHAGKPWTSHSMYQALRREMTRLGMPGLSIHGVRKLFATSIADGGGSVHQIAAGTGHQTLGMVALYTRGADQRKLGAEAVRLLPKFGKDK